MADQLRLFPEAEDVPNETSEEIRTAANALDELYTGAYAGKALDLTKRMLDTVARFPQYSIFNAFLIHTQRPEASMVATAGVWEKRYNRRPISGARPIVILAPMSPVHFVYDIGDTEGEPVPQAIPDVQDAAAGFSSGAYDCVCRNCRLHGIAVRSVSGDAAFEAGALSLTYNIRKQYESLNLDGRFNYLVLADEGAGRESRFADLAYGLSLIFLGHLGIDHRAWWKDRRGTPRNRAEAEARAAAFLVCVRRGLFFTADRFRVTEENQDGLTPPFSLSAVFSAAQYIEEMGKACWEEPRKKSRYE